jgi:hypothetical protein
MTVYALISVNALDLNAYTECAHWLPSAYEAEFHKYTVPMAFSSEGTVENVFVQTEILT